MFKTKKIKYNNIYILIRPVKLNPIIQFNFVPCFTVFTFVPDKSPL